MAEHEFSINCKEEEQRFDALLRFEEPARIMAIRAPGASGKSHFTQRLERKCRNAAEPVPVALLDFSVFRDTDRVAFTRQLARVLKGVDFMEFERLVRDFSMRNWNSVRGANNFGGANLGGAQFNAIGTNINAQGAGSVSVASSSIRLDTQDAIDAAAEDCVTTFFQTLVIHCQQRPAVIILDTYDQCDPGLRSWLEDQLERLSMGGWPERLVIVVAAKDVIEPFGARWPAAHLASRVVPVEGLGTWQPEDIEDGFREVGFAELPPDTPNILEWLAKGATPGALVGLMQAVANSSGNIGR
jgi:hypothetical protein